MDLDRRGFMKLASLTALSASIPSLAFADDKKKTQQKAAAASRYKTKRVIVVAFAGGVRSRETIGAPENIPNLMKIAQEGVILPHVATRNVGHYGAAMSIFTGQIEEKGIRENERVESPTVFEYVRKQRELAAKDVWLSTSGGDQQLNYAYGTHADYGAAYGANLIGGDGVFNSEFKDLLQHFGRPRTDDGKERSKLDDLRHALDQDALKKRVKGSDEIQNDPDTKSRIEKFILDELTGSTTNITGPGSGDARAIRIAKNILGVFRPTLLGIALSNADVAHGSFNGYVEVVRRNDQELGALWAAVQADPELKGTTSLFVLPEFGRDHDLNQRQGLDHGDSSKDLSEIACFAIGPDFKQNQVVTDEVKWTQVCPTVCELLGAQSDKTKEKKLETIFA
jgi:hypothetical protein